MQPSLPCAEQFQISQPVFTEEVLQSPHQLCGPPLDSPQQNAVVRLWSEHLGISKTPTERFFSCSALPLPSLASSKHPAATPHHRHEDLYLCHSFWKGVAYIPHCISDIKANIASLCYANSYASFRVSAGNLSTIQAEMTTLAPSLACTAVISAHTKPLATAI